MPLTNFKRNVFQEQNYLLITIKVICPLVLLLDRAKKVISFKDTNLLDSLVQVSSTQCTFKIIHRHRKN